MLYRCWTSALVSAMVAADVVSFSGLCTSAWCSVQNLDWHVHMVRISPLKNAFVSIGIGSIVSPLLSNSCSRYVSQCCDKNPLSSRVHPIFRWACAKSCTWGRSESASGSRFCSQSSTAIRNVTPKLFGTCMRRQYLMISRGNSVRNLILVSCVHRRR